MKILFSTARLLQHTNLREIREMDGSLVCGNKRQNQSYMLLWRVLFRACKLFFNFEALPMNLDFFPFNLYHLENLSYVCQWEKDVYIKLLAFFGQNLCITRVSFFRGWRKTKKKIANFFIQYKYQLIFIPEKNRVNGRSLWVNIFFLLYCI